jgi:myo-inositol-1-phosphate synthase
MDTSMIVNTHEQSVPMWDETENVQTINKLTHRIETVNTVPKLGVMLVGLGGNNGSTFAAGILANKKN